MNGSQSGMKVIFIVILLLIVLPLALLVLIQFVPPVQEEAPASNESAAADRSDARSVMTRERHVRNENRTVRRETPVTETVQVPFEEVGAISPYATRSKQATPYPPGTVPGDSGVLVQYAGSPDDMTSGPQPDDPWEGRSVVPIRPGMGIGGVKRVDPDDPFFQQDIPNPFAD